jgi:phage tail-like protein
MARSVSSDPLLAFNFALLDVAVGNDNVFSEKVAQTGGGAKAGFVGFQSITIPEFTLETRDIKEGNWPFSRKVHTGAHTGGEVTLSMALLSTNRDMYYWFQQAVWGRGAPRREFIVVHLRNDKKHIWRRLHLYDCIPTGWRPSTDLAGDSNEVLMEELTMDVEHIAVKDGETYIPSNRPPVPALGVSSVVRLAGS